MHIGNILDREEEMTEWIECKISDIGTVVGGATPSTKKSENYQDGIIPWITPKDLATFRGRYIKQGERKITETGLKSCSTQLLPKNTVLFSSRAPIGYIAIAANEVCTNQGFKSVIPNENIDPLFLFYLLKYNKDIIEGMGSGTTFKEVSGTTMKNIVVNVPKDKVMQEKIASIIGSIDDKIEENEKINNNLHEQTIAVFNKYYDTSTNQQPFSSIINVLSGGTPKTSNLDFWNGTIPFFTPKDAGDLYTFQTEKYITDTGLNHCNSRLYPSNTTFVTARGTVGKVSLAGIPMAMNQSCYALTSDVIDPILVYFYTLKAIESLKHKASGAVFDAIVTRDFNSEIIKILSNTDSKRILAIVSPMLENIRNNVAENMRLSTLRDTLLPHLMSGELDVSDIDL